MELEAEAYSEPRFIKNPGIFRTVVPDDFYSKVFIPYKKAWGAKRVGGCEFW